MFSIDPATGSLVVPLWTSVIALAVLVVMTIFAIARAGAARTAAALIGILALAYAGWIGWAMIDATTLPPGSIILSYWLGGAFLMAAKRLSDAMALATSAPFMPGI